MPRKFLKTKTKKLPAKRLPAKTRLPLVTSYGPTLPLYEDLSDEELRAAVLNAPMFLSWYSALRAYALKRIVGGVGIPGVKLVDGSPVRQYDESKESAFAAAIRAKGEEPYRLIGLKAADAILGAAVMAKMTTKVCRHQVVVSDSDARPAAKPQSRYLSDDSEGEP